ncbi:hypothetical protein SCG7109_AF_00080 [Chlamydiales bacterium SCGC AG-110-M15]|nr:hypothetical protein SCG7109_AF_00080 [Chlamydiales bacterium SCGC AG-110-M15]
MNIQLNSVDQRREGLDPHLNQINMHQRFQRVKDWFTNSHFSSDESPEFLSKGYQNYSFWCAAKISKLGDLFHRPTKKGFELIASAKHYTPGKKVVYSEVLAFRLAQKVYHVSVRILCVASGAALVAFTLPTTGAVGGVLKVFASQWKYEVSYAIGNVENSKSLEHGESFRLRSENQAALFNSVGKLNNLRDLNQRMHEQLELIKESDADIFLGQEVFTDSASHTLCEGLLEKYPYILHSIDPQEFGINSGLFFASKFPIKQFAFKRFSESTGEDALANKGVLLVTLEIAPGKHLLVTNTHLQAKFDTGADKTYSKIRQHQLKEIEEAISLYTFQSDVEFVGTVNAGDYNLADGQTDEDVPAPHEKYDSNENKCFFNKYKGEKEATQETLKSTWYDQTAPSFGTDAWGDNAEKAVLDGFVPDFMGYAPAAVEDGKNQDLRFESLIAVSEGKSNKVSPSTDHLAIEGTFSYCAEQEK